MAGQNLLFMDSKIEYTHTTYTQQPDIGYHFHDFYEVYFLISGNLDYFVENKVYHIHRGDLLIMNNNEIHRPFFKDFTTYERVVIYFEPGKISEKSLRLLDAFTKRKSGEKNLIKLSSAQTEELLGLFKKFERLEEEPDEYSETLRLAYLLEVLALINKAFKNTRVLKEIRAKNEIISEILKYIDEHLDTELSLEQLEKRFNYNKTYLCRLFKQNTGSSIHKHILYKRVAKSKALISEGFSVFEACVHCGFNDYSSFYRVFKSTVGISPVDYKRSVNRLDNSQLGLSFGRSDNFYKQ